MCLEAMDTRAKHIKPVHLRKTLKPGSKLGWKLPRILTEEAEALKCRVTAVRTIRKYLRRQQKRGQLAKLADILGDIGNNKKNEPVSEDSRAAACVYRQPSGAMAPENTTQYLMGNVYEDMTTDSRSAPVSHETSAHMYSKSVSPRVYDALGSDYESCLAFQQRDFEEVFDLTW